MLILFYITYIKFFKIYLGRKSSIIVFFNPLIPSFFGSWSRVTILIYCGIFQLAIWHGGEFTIAGTLYPLISQLTELLSEDEFRESSRANRLIRRCLLSVENGNGGTSRSEIDNERVDKITVTFKRDQGNSETNWEIYNHLFSYLKLNIVKKNCGKTMDKKKHLADRER